jgi:hypothetical protein
MASEEERKEFQDLHEAVGKLKSAKNEADKTSATNEISKLLDKWFKRDMERREKQIAEIEERVKKLREQIDKRKKAKEDIINLRLKTIVNEADGLGFPGGFEHDVEGFGPPRNGFHVFTPPRAAHFDVTPTAPAVPDSPIGVPGPEEPSP